MRKWRPPDVSIEDESAVKHQIVGPKFYRLDILSMAHDNLPIWPLLVPYNKQLNNLDRSVLTGKSQTSAYRIDLAIARSIWQGLSFRFSPNYLTLGY